MIDDALTWMLRRIGFAPCMQIFGKARTEPEWRTIDVIAGKRRNHDSGWPLLAGTCTVITSQILAVGWDFAERLLAEQQHAPATRQTPIEVAGGRLQDPARRLRAGGAPACSLNEILAHECGHTAQARRLGAFYLPLVGSVTLFREGTHFWNHWENDASERGLFGGIARVLIAPDQWPRQSGGVR